MNNKIIMLILFAVTFAFVNMLAAEEKMTVKTLTNLRIYDKEITAQFSGISANAVEAGLKDTIIHGSVSYEKLAAGNVRVRVSWHTLEKQKLGSSRKKSLTKPLQSSMVVGVEEIPAQTRVTAVGELDEVIAAFNTILDEETASGGNTRRYNITESEEDEKATGLNNIGAGVSGRSAGISGSNYDDGLIDTNDHGISADLIQDRQVACNHRVDIDGMTLYYQSRTDQVNEAGVTVATGTCEDTDQTLELYRKYGGDCGVTPDIDNLVAYQSYRVVALVDGVTTIYQDCMLETDDHLLAIHSTASDCAVTHDFNNSATIQQERLYYLDNKGETGVRGCQNGEVTYAHYTTTSGCEVIVNTLMGTAFSQSRIAYQDSTGAVGYATDCAVTEGDGGIAIQSEACENPKYEHDFTNGQSYLLKVQYYLNDGEKVYINTCGRSATSYPHLRFTEDCGVINDDDDFRSYLKAITAIETGDDGTIEIAPCATYDTVSYVYITQEIRYYETYSSSALVTRNTSSFGVIATGNPPPGSPYNCPGAAFHPNCPVRGYYYVHSYEWADGIDLVKDSPWVTLDAGDCYDTISLWPPIGEFYCDFVRVRDVSWKTYQRADDSLYEFWDQNVDDTTKGRTS